MRGSPLLRALVAFVAILLLGVPLWRLTRDESPAAQPTPIPSVEAGKQSVVKLALTFTTPPSSLKVLHLGKEVWNANTPTAEMQQDLSLEFPKEGIDLQFDLTWPENGTSAMRVVLTDPQGVTHEKSVWGHGAVSEVVTFP